MQFELTEEFLITLHEAIRARRADFVMTQLKELHPPDIAEIFNKLEIFACSVVVHFQELVRLPWLQSTSNGFQSHLIKSAKDLAPQEIK